jgi:hypothetical protein
MKQKNYTINLRYIYIIDIVLIAKLRSEKLFSNDLLLQVLNLQ